MTVVRLEIADEEELRSLDEWLRGEEVLRGRVALVAQPPPSGAMGSPVDALLVAIGEAAESDVLARSLEIWLRLRGPEVKIMVRVGDQVAELSASDNVDVTALLRLAVQAVGG
jgi:hypothetical protein